jgi:hypothetical protein
MYNCMLEVYAHVLPGVLARSAMCYRGKCHAVQGLLAKTMQVHCGLEVYMCSEVWRISDNK